MGEGAAPLLSNHRSEWREQAAELRLRLDRPIADRDTLLDLLLGPLDLLALPISDHLSSDVARHGDWNRLQLGPKNREEAIRHHRWIEDVQLLLLRKVLPDWQAALQSDDLLGTLLQLWFCPSTSGEGTESHVASGCMAISALHTITILLSDFSRRSSAKEVFRSETWNLVQDVMTIFLQNFSLPSMVRFCTSLPSKARQDLAWQDATRELISLPDRLANAFQGKTSPLFEAEQIRSDLAAKLENLVASGTETEAYTKALLIRMQKGGWFQFSTEWQIRSLNVWPSLLRAIVSRVHGHGFPKEYLDRWQKVLGLLDADGRSSILASLVLALDQHCCQASAKANFLNGSEQFRPGSEGMTFLAEDTWQESLRLGIIVQSFIGEEDVASPSLLVDIILSPALRALSPLMGRILAHLVLQRDVSGESAGQLLIRAIKIWAEQASTVSMAEESYLATIVALLIRSAPIDDKALSYLNTSPDFIKGVSRHLEHLSPAVRRLGMLVAELASERTGKSLSFGKRIWDGRGEGREEARVLRAAALGFPSRAENVLISSETLLIALRLQGASAQNEEGSLSVAIHPRIKSEPRTRALPERRPPPERRKKVQEKGTGQRATLLGGGEKNSSTLPLLGNISGSQSQARPKVVMLSDDEASSSDSDSNSSNEDREEEGVELADGPEEGKAFGMAAPSKSKKVHIPIYISDVVPLLRQNERDSVKMGLHHAASLIERKAGWGREVDENAVDVCLALCSLQNNFGIKEFDQYRVDALTALVVASPQRIAPCLAEQYFDNHYSMAQRISMLNAMAFGASRLAGGKGEERSANTSANASTLAHQFAQMAMTRARKEGEERMPEIKREQSLLVSKGRTNDVAQTAYSFKKAEGDKFLSFASASFIFPLVNKFWTHMQQTSFLPMKRGTFIGSGRKVIDMPFMVGAFFDTLAVLCFHAQNEHNFRSQIVPEVLQAILTFTRPHLAQLAIEQGDLHQNSSEPDTSEGGGRSTVLGAAASLCLVLLDASWQLDFGAFFARQQATVLLELQMWANAIFESANGGSFDRSVGAINRMGRTSAALVLRINEIQEHQRDKLHF